MIHVSNCIFPLIFVQAYFRNNHSAIQTSQSNWHLALTRCHIKKGTQTCLLNLIIFNSYYPFSMTDFEIRIALMYHLKKKRLVAMETCSLNRSLASICTCVKSLCFSKVKELWKKKWLKNKYFACFRCPNHLCSVEF